MVGCVLAGGRGSRIGGAKALVPLAGRPLVLHPLAAVAAVCRRAVVVAKRDTELPAEVERWDEPDHPVHPLTGIVAALERARGDDVLVVAADLPLLRPVDLEPLLDGDGVRWADGEPLCAVYPASVLGELRAAAPGAPLRATVRSLGPRAVAVPRGRLLNVNTPQDLAEAERVLARDGNGYPG